MTATGSYCQRLVDLIGDVMAKVTKPVARLVPEETQRSDDVRRAVAGLRELQQQIRRRSKAKLSNREVRSAIDEGRS